ncbi:uncharacterized protein LOC142795433 [Rhipicephalus microplus]|uniref:uncharacterized protein LOC142795433 n=1 Tax=Rhipicephalus microplus TaxID=6941 RepID=UPI003F6D675C
MRINGSTFKKLIDTGAAVSLFNVQDYKRNFSHIKLLSSHLILQNYLELVINNLGYFKATVSYNGNCATILFYITDKGTSLLELDAIGALKIIRGGETLTCSLVDFSAVPANAPQEYHHLFSSDIGTPEAAKLRHLPFLLRQQVASELQRLESTAINERVDASEWVSPLVVVRKRDNPILVAKM